MNTRKKIHRRENYWYTIDEETIKKRTLVK